MRVCVNALIDPAADGGVAPAIAGMAHGLSALGGSDEYIFLVYEDARAWLAPHLSGRCRLIGCPRPAQHAVTKRIPSWLRGVLPLARRIRHALRPLAHALPDEPAVVAELAPDVIHHAHQAGFRTARPVVYHPYDLQYRHFPGNFARHDWERIDYIWSENIRQARVCVALTEWGRRDLIDQYRLAPERVVTIPLATPLHLQQRVVADPAPILARLGLAAPYAIFPAQTWPHKNHDRLIRAWPQVVAALGPQATLVLTGRLTRAPELRRLARSLGVETQVRMLGFLPGTEVAAAIAGAHLLVYPSLFEGWGLPVCEGFLAGVPVACADATCLPEVTGDAALRFDPRDPAAIAEAVITLWRDAELRRRLVERGRQRASAWSWQRTAEMLADAYRKAAHAA